MQAPGRNALKLLSMTLMIGFMIAGWTARNQTPQDMIAGSCVTAQA
jgi:hypothetical protein